MPDDIAEALRLAGWHPWSGGECPVDENSYPMVLDASGDTDCERASDFQWQWSEENPGSNIIAYKVTA